MNLLTLLFSFSLWSFTLFGSPAALTPEEKMWYDAIEQMSDDDKMQLWNGIVEEVQKEANKLPESEREKFLEAFWSEVSNEAMKLEEKLQAEAAPEIPEAPVLPTPAAKPEEKVAPPAPKPSAKIDQAAQLIDSLLAKIENTLRKAHTIPDMSGKVQDWIKRSSIQGTPAGTNWNSFRTALENFVQQLYTLKERDPKTREYRHLQALIAHETLYNALAQLNSVLTQNEPSIEAPELGAVTISAKSQTALQKVLNGLAESLYRLQVSMQVNNIILQYDIRASQLKQEQEAAVKAASAQAGKPTKQTPVTAAGQAPVAPSGQRAKEPSYPLYEPSLRELESSYRPSRPSFEETSKPSTAREGGVPGAPKAPAGREPEKGKPAPAAKAETRKPETKEDEKKKDEKDKGRDVTSKRMDTLILQMENVIDVLSDTPLKYISNYMIKPSDVDVNLANTILPNAISKVRKAVDTARSLKRALTRLKPDELKSYKKEFADLLAVNEKPLQDLISQIEYVRSNQRALNADKAYAFIDSKREPQTAALRQTIANPSSLYELQAKTAELLDTLKSVETVEVKK